MLRYLWDSRGRLPGPPCHNRRVQHVDILVRGSGIVGRSLALSLARLGLEVAVCEPPQRQVAATDVRAYALNAASVALLRRLEIWDALPATALTAVDEMRIEGDAPGAELTFSAWEQRVGELAWIVDAAVLERELAAAMRFAPEVVSVDAAVAAQLDVALEALCEGSGSASRAARGISYETVHFGQQAIAARLTGSLDHQGVARQWFRSPDVLALLPFDTPLPKHSHALVWSLPDAAAQRLMALDDAAFEAELNAATKCAAGTLRLASVRAAWPLMRAQADAWCGEGWVLLGDAAHQVHPLAGQGLNLGLADVATLSRVVAAREVWRPLGDERLLRRYARARLAPTRAMAELTDGLMTLFAHDAPGLRELRNRGLGLFDRLKPVKRWLTARAVGT